MRLGLIARADSRGLGIQTKAVFDHLNPVKTMVVDCPSAKPLPLRRDWYPEATWITGLPTRVDFRAWLDGVDVVYTAETAYGPHLWTEAARAGVKTVLHANYEFLDRRDQPTLWAAPSMWHFNDFPNGSKFLPVPIETDRFIRADFPTVRRFLHIVGRPAIHDRNGTLDLLKALTHVTSEVTVTVRCQEATYVPQLMSGISIPSNVTLNVESGDLLNYWDAYTDQDVLVMPRRFGGLCLPANEALGAGMPVIMPAISPNGWLPSGWLVPASKTASFMAKTRIDIHETAPRLLAAKIDEFASDSAFFTTARKNAQALAEGLSWDTLKPVYEKTLEVS